MATGWTTTVMGAAGAKDITELEKLPKVPDGPCRNFPEYNLKPMSRQALCVQFGFYMWCNLGGRQPERSEVTALMRVKVYNQNYIMKHMLFDRFEDSDNNLTQLFQALDEESKEAWRLLIYRWYNELLSEDAILVAIANNLGGM